MSNPISDLENFTKKLKEIPENYQMDLANRMSADKDLMMFAAIHGQVMQESMLKDHGVVVKSNFMQASCLTFLASLVLQGKVMLIK